MAGLGVFSVTDLRPFALRSDRYLMKRSFIRPFTDFTDGYMRIVGGNITVTSISVTTSLDSPASLFIAQICTFELVDILKALNHATFHGTPELPGFNTV